MIIIALMDSKNTPQNLCVGYDSKILYPRMGGKIPESIRRKVLRQWLEGYTRLQIARDNQIGTGTVSEII
jgi:hypothetical protein